MNTARAMIAALGLMSIGATASASDCGNFFGQRCFIELATGVHMSYFDVGSAHGTNLIFLHTDTTGAVEWAWTANALARLNPNLHMFALDQRGAGSSDLPNTRECWATPNVCITRADLAADLLAFMDAKGIDKAILVGHAMGAGAARDLALHHPDRVIKLVLSGTGPPRAAAAAPAGAATAALSEEQSAALRPLGWEQMLTSKGVKWPQGALHMRPLDIDPDAVRNITRHWDISAIAAPEVVDAIAAQTAAESLAGWGVLDPTPEPPAAREALEQLTVPTLILWGSEDAGLNKSSQQRLIEVMRKASQNHPGMYFYWKQYGVRPPPASGDKHQADDIGHNLSWEAPQQLAADIDSFVRTGAPTRDLYRTDAPANIRTILVEPGKAVIVSSK
jgi:pimeloyl-ACP methyl ester carboxylesterase